MKAGAETPATAAVRELEGLVRTVRSMKAGAETPATALEDVVVVTVDPCAQ